MTARSAILTQLSLARNKGSDWLGWFLSLPNYKQADRCQECYIKLPPAGSSLFHFILEDVGKIILYISGGGWGGYNVH